MVNVVNGLITLRGFNPIIVTIGSLSVLTGLAAVVAKGYTFPGLTQLEFMGTHRYFRVEEDWEEVARGADTIARDTTPQNSGRRAEYTGRNPNRSPRTASPWKPGDSREIGGRVQA